MGTQRGKGYGFKPEKAFLLLFGKAKGICALPMPGQIPSPDFLIGDSLAKRPVDPCSSPMDGVTRESAMKQWATPDPLHAGPDVQQEMRVRSVQKCVAQTVIGPMGPSMHQNTKAYMMLLMANPLHANSDE